MSDTLSDILAQTSDPTPAPETVQPDTSTQTSDNAPTSQDVEVPDDVRIYLEQNPDHKPIADTLNKQFQKAFTGRLQEAAELRKLVDGVDPNSINTLRQLQQLAQTNPEQVAQWYRSQADLLHNPQPNTQQQADTNDPWAGIEPVTDAEALLLQQVKEMSQWRNQFTQQQEQQSLMAKGVQVKQERNAIQQEFGVTIPDTELVQVWDVAEKSGLSIRQAYLALNNERVLPTLLQRARDEASGIVQNKVNMNAGNPNSIPVRTPVNNNTKGSLQDYFSEVRNK